ncbi:Os09g0135100, partial [Oryza sativa Japonica Group]
DLQVGGIQWTCGVSLLLLLHQPAGFCRERRQKHHGIGGFVFGNERSESKEDSYVERFLDCISNGTIPDDSRSAMTELQPLVAESHSAQMSFGAMGLFSSTF